MHQTSYLNPGLTFRSPHHALANPGTARQHPPQPEALSSSTDFYQMPFSRDTSTQQVAPLSYEQAGFLLAVSPGPVDSSPTRSMNHVPTDCGARDRHLHVPIFPPSPFVGSAPQASPTTPFPCLDERPDDHNIRTRSAGPYPKEYWQNGTRRSRSGAVSLSLPSYPAPY